MDFSSKGEGTSPKFFRLGKYKKSVRCSPDSPSPILEGAGLAHKGLWCGFNKFSGVFLDCRPNFSVPLEVPRIRKCSNTHVFLSVLVNFHGNALCLFSSLFFFLKGWEKVAWRANHFVCLLNQLLGNGKLMLRFPGGNTFSNCCSAKTNQRHVQFMVRFNIQKKEMTRGSRFFYRRLLVIKILRRRKSFSCRVS